ncbi:MAG: nucleoside recognition protein [Lachnospiraceae bacterium]|nr:nucleoside recognition protein [Lachnospiraceae bacterium]
MLNYIWAFMILLGVVCSIFTGRLDTLAQAALNSAGDAVSLCITMAGVVSLWMGLMEIAKEAGLIQKMTKGISPFLDFLFPRIPKGHMAREYIATNLIANILGLGWACTPAGLKAMEELAKLERERGNSTPHIASNEMCTFLILNVSSLQLIPVNMLAYRSQYASINPTIIIGPAIATTLISTIVAVIYCMIKDRDGRRAVV